MTRMEFEVASAAVEESFQALLRTAAALVAVSQDLSARIEALRGRIAQLPTEPGPPTALPPAPPAPPPTTPPPAARTESRMREIFAQEMAKESIGTFTESQFRGWLTHFSSADHKAMNDQQFRAAVRAMVLQDMEKFPGQWPPRIKPQDVAQPVLRGMIQLPPNSQEPG